LIQSERSDCCICLCCKIKRQLEKVLGLKVKTVPVGILGTAENATLGLIVTGPSVKRYENLQNGWKPNYALLPGTTEIKLTVEDGNQKLTFKLIVIKWPRWTDAVVGLTMQTTYSGNTVENLELE
jgi:HAE1 family hydrophobic/amphiphilic exporter-1